MDGQQIEVLRDSFLVNVGQFFVLLGKNVLLQVAREGEQLGLDGDVLVFPYDKLGLVAVATVLTGASALEKLFLWSQVRIIAHSACNYSALLALATLWMSTLVAKFIACSSNP